MRPTIKDKLDTPIYLIAKKMGRNFPSHIMDIEDFQQEGWIGALKIKERVGESEEELLTRCRVAAWSHSINAMRRFRDSRGCRDLEIIVDDITQYERSIPPEDDFALIIKNLSLREKTILWMLMADYTLAEIGQKLYLTEGRIHQIRGGLFTYLQKVL